MSIAIRWKFATATYAEIRVSLASRNTSGILLFYIRTMTIAAAKESFYASQHSVMVVNATCNFNRRNAAMPPQAAGHGP